MKRAFALGLTGFSLIAVTYGMARFSWGLMMPAIIRDIAFSPRVSGMIAACSYVAYCLAMAAASRCVRRFGPRLPAMISALSAAAGLFLLASASSSQMLAFGLFIGGLSSGLASPVLADAVTRTIPVEQQTVANTVINAGTSAGIIASVIVLFLVPGGWRIACIIFGVMALLCLPPIMRFIPGKTGHSPVKTAGWRQIISEGSIRRLILISFVSGTASAAWWSFGPDIMHHQFALKQATTNLLWLIGGGAGILAVLTGPAIAAIGMKQVYRLSQLFMAAPLLLFALLHGFSWWLFPAVALVGAGYVILSGVLLVCATSTSTISSASGVAAAFFALAGGQIAGSVIFGQLYARIGAPMALSAFAALSLMMLFLVPRQNGAAERGR